MFLWFPVEELGRIHDVLMIHGNEKLDKKTIDKIAHLINISKDTGLFNKYDVEIYERNQQCKKDA
jgi:CTP synthase (UTP-ammonia lyase)